MRRFALVADLGGTKIAAARVDDTGRITQYDTLWTNALPAGHPNDYSISGWGVGAALSATDRASLRLMWAKKIGNNPNPTLTGTDSDGTRDSARIWIIGNILF